MAGNKKYIDIRFRVNTRTNTNFDVNDNSCIFKYWIENQSLVQVFHLYGYWKHNKNVHDIAPAT